MFIPLGSPGSPIHGHGGAMWVDFVLIIEGVGVIVRSRFRLAD